jgi:phage virion morphogenesis protein
MSDLATIEAFASDLLARLEPSARTELAKRIAKDLRASQQKRIAAQLNPDGSGFAPRKTQLRSKKGRIRQQMFTKLRTARYLKAKGTSDAAIVSFTEQVSRIARVHQLGLRDRVNRKTSLEADYAQRELLGLSAADEAMIRDLSVDYLAGR